MLDMLKQANAIVSVILGWTAMEEAVGPRANIIKNLWPMPVSATPIFSYYRDPVLAGMARLSLNAQLEKIKGLRIVLLDYCGMLRMHIKPFSIANAKMFEIDDPGEDVSGLLQGYDVVYVMLYEGQNVYIEFGCIKAIFNRNRIVSMSYFPGASLDAKVSGCVYTESGR